MLPQIGDSVAGYRIEGIIGRGGMGVVFLAEHRHLARKVALKVVAPALADDERFRERFLRESRLAGSLDHPNIITIHDAGETGGLLYLAMHYVPGKDLAKLIREDGSLDPQRAISIVSDVGAALDAAHSSNLVHRDVKPNNILLTPPVGRRPEWVYLTDFGLSKRAASVSGLTVSGEILGTVPYMAPEQLRGKGVDHRADIYALGCVLFECLIGRPPFVREDPQALFFAHLSDPPPAVSELREELPPELDAVIQRALAKEPEERYFSCEEFTVAAKRLLYPAPAPPLPGPTVVDAAEPIAERTIVDVADHATVAVRDDDVADTLLESYARVGSPVTKPPGEGEPRGDTASEIPKSRTPLSRRVVVAAAVAGTVLAASGLFALGAFNGPSTASPPASESAVALGGVTSEIPAVTPESAPTLPPYSPDPALTRAENELVARIPGLRPCAPETDTEFIDPDAVSTLRCRSGVDGTDVWYDLYANSSDLDAAFAALRERYVDDPAYRISGTCWESAAHGYGPYAHGDDGTAGEIICVEFAEGVGLFWTYDALTALGSASRDDLNSGRLFGWWLDGEPLPDVALEDIPQHPVSPEDAS